MFFNDSPTVALLKRVDDRRVSFRVRGRVGAGEEDDGARPGTKRSRADADAEDLEAVVEGVLNGYDHYDLVPTFRALSDEALYVAIAAGAGADAALRGEVEAIAARFRELLLESDRAVQMQDTGRLGAILMKQVFSLLLDGQNPIMLYLIGV